MRPSPRRDFTSTQCIKRLVYRKIVLAAVDGRYKHDGFFFFCGFRLSGYYTRTVCEVFGEPLEKKNTKQTSNTRMPRVLFFVFSLHRERAHLHSCTDNNHIIVLT